MTGFAEELARCGDLPKRILETHVDDGSGHCCLCSAGAQTGRYVHPCSLRSAAIEALAIQRRFTARERSERSRLRVQRDA